MQNEIGKVEVYEKEGEKIRKRERYKKTPLKRIEGLRRKRK